MNSFDNAMATDGVILNLSSCAFTLNYTGSVLNYIEMVQNGNTYRQTFTWDGSNLTAVSAWVKQ